MDWEWRALSDGWGEGGGREGIEEREMWEGKSDLLILRKRWMIVDRVWVKYGIGKGKESKRLR